MVEWLLGSDDSKERIPDKGLKFITSSRSPGLLYIVRKQRIPARGLKRDHNLQLGLLLD